ncbi:SMC-Scp complex subunit ScpB [Arvimicrobium flavum]|uniref:SMC-Scp complex subunit ScpB n=1 Tax=Arvimicrobium flavum TaxID=3393320 RepID=UPI003083F7B6
MRDRPYEMVAVAGGWQHRTRPRLAGAIRALGITAVVGELSQHESLVLMAVADFQPVTRGELRRIFCKEVSRDTIAALPAIAGSRPGRAARSRARPTLM